MDGFVNPDNEEFKTPQAMFIQELDAVEKYSNKNPDALSRVSLFNQFDPLVSTAKPLSPKMEEVEEEEEVFKPRQTPPRGNNIRNNEEQPLCDISVTDANVTMNLVQVNTPKVEHVQATNGINGHLTPSPFEELFSQLLHFNQQTMAICLERQNLLAEKNEIIDNLEGQLFDLHAKYENLRTASKEYSKNTESHLKEQLDSMNQRLKEKDDEMRNQMMDLATLSEDLNRRIQGIMTKP